MSDSPEALELSKLSEDIGEAVNEFIANYEQDGSGRPPMVVERPQKFKEMMLELALGHSALSIEKKLGISRMTVSMYKSDWADHLGEWRQVGGRIAGGLFFDAADRTVETQDRLDEAEKSGDSNLIKALASSLAARTKLIETTHRQATVSRGDVTERTATKQERPDFEEMMKAVAELHKTKQAEVIDIEE